MEALSTGDLKKISDAIIPDCVDQTIFYLLHAIDNGELKLTFTAPNGENVDLTDGGFGEMAGWYAGEDNWRERFSKERINNYLT